MKYSYDPTRINENGLDQMRFELGDTETKGREKTCILCDEEYLAILSGLEKGKSWRSLKIQCLESIVSKFAHEVDYSVDKMELKLSDRYKHFKELLEELKKSNQNPFSTKGNGNYYASKEPYFYLGMQENPYVK